MNGEAKKKGAPTSEDEMVRWIYYYRVAWANLGGLPVEHDGTIIGREMWARAGWKFSMTGAFEAPVGVRLPNATPSDAGYPGAYGTDTFRLYIGADTIPL